MPDDIFRPGLVNSEAPFGSSSIVATAGTAVSRLTGLVRLGAMAYVLGVAETRLADTYNLANTTPNMIYELVLGGVLSGVVLRVFLEVRESQGSEEAWRFITRLSNVAMAFLVLVAAAGALAAPLIMRAYSFRAPAEIKSAQQSAGALLLALLLPQVIFYGLNTIATAVLRAHGRFGVFMFVPALNNLVVTGAFIAFAISVPAMERNLGDVPSGGLFILGSGTSAGVVLLGLIPWLYSRRVGRRRIRGAGWYDPRFARLAKLSAYTAGYVITNQLGLWAILVLANRIQGGVAARDIAFIFFQLPHGLLAVSISMVVGTELALHSVASRLDQFAIQLTAGLRGITFVVLPAAAGYIAISPEIIRLLIEHGFATSASTALVSYALRAYAVGLMFFSFWHLLLSAFQGMGDTRTPMFVNIGAFFVYVIGAYTLFGAFDTPQLKMAGLGLSHAASYVVASALGLWLLSRRVHGIGYRQLYRTFIRALFAAALTAGAARTIATTVESVVGVATLPTQIVQILLATTGGLLLYVVLAKIMRMEELNWVWDALRGRGRMSPAR